MATFANLPNSVLARIMGCLDSPADLFAVVSSCRPARVAFGGEEARVLVQVIVNAFGINLHEAVCLVTAPAFDAQQG